MLNFPESQSSAKNGHNDGRKRTAPPSGIPPPGVKVLPPIARIPPPLQKIKKEEREGVEIPELAHDYHASGLLILPHSGIAEPFEIWYAPSKQKSRIDYYYGKKSIAKR